MVCASLALGNSGSDVVTRLSTKIYEACRGGGMTLPNFPDFTATINALREGTRPQNNASYKVCVQQHDRLKILESMAAKWVNTDCLKDKALNLIEKHNGNFNPDAEMWVEDRTYAIYIFLT